MFKKLLTVTLVLFAVSACKTGSHSKNAGAGQAGHAVPGSQEDLNATAGDRVLFAFDSSVLSEEAKQTLAKQAAWLQQNAQVKVSVEGHCDERGTREYNLALGERRANAAKKYLVSLGVAADRLSTVSYGKERPAVEGNNDAAYAQNRRAVTTLSN